MQVYLKADYLCRTDNGTRRDMLTRCVNIPATLRDVEFYANSEGSARKIVAVEIEFRFHGEDVQKIWVSPECLYDCGEHMSLIQDKHFWVWCRRQWLRQKDPDFEKKFAEVHDLVVNHDLEDQDAFDAIEALGFCRWAADIILNEYCP